MTVRGPALDPAQLIAQRRRESDSFTALAKRTTTVAQGYAPPPRVGALFASQSAAATRVFPHQHRPARPAPQPRRVSNENKHSTHHRSPASDDEQWTDDQLSTTPDLDSDPKTPNHHSTYSPTTPLSPRRTSASFTAVRQNGYVSSSPFKAGTDKFPSPSPRRAAPTKADKSGMGLGRPHGPPTLPQLASVSLPDTPFSSTPPRPLSASPASALSPTRRGGAKGPRPPPTTTPPRSRPPISSGDETETEEDARSTTPTRFAQAGSGRATPGGTKTVTWATDEDVLVFEVESDNSLMSASVASDDSRESSLELEAGDGGGDGSIVIIDDSVDVTDTESVIDEMLEEIDGALEHNRSPRQSTLIEPGRFEDEYYRSELVDFDQQPTNFHHRHSADDSPRDGYAMLSPSTVSTYLAAASPSLTATPNLDRGDNGSNSSYDEDEEDAIAREVLERKEKERIARAHIVSRSKTTEPFRPTLSNRSDSSSPPKVTPTSLPSLPVPSSAAVDVPVRSSFPSATYSSTFAPPTAITKPTSTLNPYSLPTLEESSPFLGFGPSDLSTISSPKDYYTTSTFSAPSAIKAPTAPAALAVAAAAANLDRSESIVSRRASILDTSTCSYSSASMSGSLAGSVSSANTSRSTAAPTRPMSELAIDVFGPISKVDSAPARPLSMQSSSTSTGSYPPLASPSSHRIRAIPARPPLNASSTSETIKPLSDDSTLLPSLFVSPTKSDRSSIDVVQPRMVAKESALDQLSKSIRKLPEEVRVVATPRRRRSRSTGQLDERVSVPTQNRFSFLEASIDEGDSFLAGMQTHEREIFRQRGIIEHKTVYATDRLAPIAPPHSAGDVIAGKAWKKKRASDVHGTTMGKGARGVEPAGKVFVTVVNVELPNLPLPNERTMVECVVKRNAPCSLGSFPMSSTIPISKQIELTYSPNLEFTFELSINTRSIANAHLAPANLLPVTPSLKGKSSFSRLKQLVSPSKKPRIVEAPTPTILQYTDLDKHSGTGVLASVRIDFARDAAASKNRVVHLSFPLHSASSHASSSTTPSFISSAINKPLPGGAKVNVKFFYLPAIEGVDGRDMPRSVKECIEGISLAEKEAKKQAVMMKEGTLTQVGGDCDTWRERDFTLKGTRFIPRSKITKKAYIEFDLALALSLTDLNNVKVYDDTNPHRADRSFKILFKDGNEVFFFAATDREKEEWMTALRTVIGAAGGLESASAVPAWATAFVKARDA